MEPINVNLSCDIQQPVKVRYLDGYFFSKDSAGHRINVDVFDNGVPVSVGGSVSAEVVRSDGETVPVTGAVSANRAYVILPQAAYAVVGAVQITIKVTEGTTIVTIACFVAYVHESDTGITVDPGTIIPSVQALISQIETAVASIPADYSSLWTSLAPAFSTSTPYAVGQYVTNSGVLYRFTTAHPAGTWNSAHVTAVNLGAEVYNLKSAITALDDIVIAEFDLSNYGTYHINISPSSGKWVANPSHNSYYFDVPTNATVLRIKSNETNGTVYALLSESDAHVADTYPSYATGCTRTFIPAGGSVDVAIPKDCKSIWITKTLSGTNYAPQYLGFNKSIPIVDDTLTQKGEAADAKTVGDKFRVIMPVSMPYSSTNGYYVKYSDGTLSSGSNFAYTDYISVDGMTQIVYSRALVSAQYNPQHGIAFYDSNKDYISGIRSIAKGNVPGYEMYVADVPENAKFVRCTIWNDTFSETYGIEPFIILNKEDYDKTLVAKFEDISNEFSPTAILHAVPQSEGVQNAILTARQFTDIMWIPVADMPGIIYSNSEYVYKTHKKGCRQKGIPYGSGLPYVQMVGDSISFDAFATAVKSADSVLYTNSVFVEGGKKACYYGVACSKLVQACWGAPELVDSQQIFNLPGISKIANAGEYTFDDIQLGDGIISPNEHCTIVTDVLKSAVTGEVVAIEISEAVTPTCRRLLWSKEEFDEHFKSYGLYRYAYIDNAKYRKARYIDLDDGYEGVKDIPIAIRRGSFINMTTSNAYKADVDNTKWTTLHDIVNGVEQTTQISSSEVAIPKDRTGYHEVYPTDSNGNRGNSSYYFVYELSVSGAVSSGSVTVTYEITSGAKPWVLVFDQYNYTFLTEDTGTITAEIPSGKTSCYVLFKSDYGTIRSSTISLT